MCRDCAKFVRGLTCTILAEDGGGASENVRGQIPHNFRYKSLLTFSLLICEDFWLFLSFLSDLCVFYTL